MGKRERIQRIIDQGTVMRTYIEGNMVVEVIDPQEEPPFDQEYSTFDEYLKRWKPVDAE